METENLWGEELVKARTELRESEVSTKPERWRKKELEQATNTVISEARSSKLRKWVPLSTLAVAVFRGYITVKDTPSS
jgi:hypothetical protein